MDRQGDAVSKRVIGCGFDVSNELGAGYFEAVYENVLSLELKRHGLVFEKQKHLNVMYRGQVVGRYVGDVVVENKLLLELKAFSTLTKEHDAQVMNYLRVIRTERWLVAELWYIATGSEQTCFSNMMMFQTL